jgi:hypothetical protein
MMTVNGHFDGKSIILDEPISLPFQSGTRLRLKIEAMEGPSAASRTPHRFQPLNIHVAPELSNAIALDPTFNIEES